MFLKIALSTKYYLHNECEGLAEVLVGEVPGQRDGAGGGADGEEVRALLLRGQAVLYSTVLYCTVLHSTCLEARLYTSEALRPRSWSQAATGPGNTVSWAGGGAGNSGEASGSTASYLQNRVIQWAW